MSLRKKRIRTCIKLTSSCHMLDIANGKKVVEQESEVRNTDLETTDFCQFKS